MSDAAPDGAPSDPNVPKRRGQVRKRHTVGKVAARQRGRARAGHRALSMVFIYRHLNGNLNVVDVTDQLTDRPDKVEVEGPKEPLNVLVMGSDTRDGEGNNIDGLTGGGERSDTTILFHLSADRKRAYGISIPRDSIVDRPECKTEDGSTIPGARRRDVERGVLGRRTGLHDPAVRAADRHPASTTTSSSTSRASRAWSTPSVGSRSASPSRSTTPTHDINIEAGTRKIKGNEALNYVRERYVVGNGSDIGRMKRQQAFIASMAHQVVTAGTLARPDQLLGFLERRDQVADRRRGPGSLVKIAAARRRVPGHRARQHPVHHHPQRSRTRATPTAWSGSSRRRSQVWAKIAGDEPLTTPTQRGRHQRRQRARLQLLAERRAAAAVAAPGAPAPTRPTSRRCPTPASAHEPSQRRRDRLGAPQAARRGLRRRAA